MALTTKDVSGRRGTISDLREKHLKLLQAENIEGKDKFIPKMAYIPKAGEDRVISFFLSELLGGQDIYTEFVSKELIPEDSERTLWKWPYNPQFETEYEKSEPHPATGHCRYLIPIAELINVADEQAGVIEQHPVKPKASPKKKSLRTLDEGEPQMKMEIPDDVPTPEEVEANEPHMHLDDDSPLSEMTIRDQVAITWIEPVSKKQWLNDLIIAKNKNDEPMHFIPG